MYKICGDSALLVLNRTSLKSINADDVIVEWVGVTAVDVVAAAVSGCCRSPDESVTRAHHEEVDNLSPI